MLESPVLKRFLAEGIAEARRKDILTILTVRLGPPTEDVKEALQTIGDESKLDELVEAAISCPDLDAFRTRLQTRSSRRRAPRGHEK